MPPASTVDGMETRLDIRTLDPHDDRQMHRFHEILWRAEKEEQEQLRLLYVALTRARERLVICGKRPANRRE